LLNGPSKGWKCVEETVRNSWSILEDSRARGTVVTRGLHVPSSLAMHRFTRRHLERQKIDVFGRSPLLLHICTSGKGYHHLQNQEKSINNWFYYFFRFAYLFLYRNFCSSIFKSSPLYLLQKRVIMGGVKPTTLPQRKEKWGEALV